MAKHRGSNGGRNSGGDGALARAVRGTGGGGNDPRARALLAELARGVDYHAVPRAELLARCGLADARAGLSRRDARRQAAAGRNSVPSPQKCPAWLCCLLPCLNSTPAMRRYNACLPAAAEVVRNGRALRMDASAVVVGDVVLLRAGCVVPADVRLLGPIVPTTSSSATGNDANDGDAKDGGADADSGWLELDVSEFCGCGMDTGRLLAPRGLVVARAPSDAGATTEDGGDGDEGSGAGSVLDAANVAFAGTTVARGAARAVVCATGRRTLMGRLIAADLWPLRMPAAAAGATAV